MMPTAPLPTAGPVETKTKAGAYATYVGAVLVFAVLTNTTTDLSFLPDWVETLLYPLIPALASLLGSYMTSHKPGQMSASAQYAARHSQL